MNKLMASTKSGLAQCTPLGAAFVSTKTAFLIFVALAIAKLFEIKLRRSIKRTREFSKRARALVSFYACDFVDVVRQQSFLAFVKNGLSLSHYFMHAKPAYIRISR